MYSEIGLLYKIRTGGYASYPQLMAIDQMKEAEKKRIQERLTGPELLLRKPLRSWVFL